MSQLLSEADDRPDVTGFSLPGATYFLTFRLENSIQSAVLDELWTESERVEDMLEQLGATRERQRLAYLEQRRLFGRWDRAMDLNREGPQELVQAAVAEVVVGVIRRLDGEAYGLDAFCVMPNHVHLVCRLEGEDAGISPDLSTIWKQLQHETSDNTRHLLASPLRWESDSYAHAVRDWGEWLRVMTYVMQNPVRAYLCRYRDEWPWSYCRFL